MKKVHIIYAACLASLTLNSCKKVLEKQDLQTFNAGEVFNDSTTTKLNIDYIYLQNQPAWFGNSGGYVGSGSNFTDEVYSDNAQVKGTMSSNDVGDIGSTNTSGNYFRIRTINTFIRDVNAGSLDIAVKRRFTAQAIFWRAYRYFELVKLYGGVPVVTVPLDAVGSDAKAAANLPRNTTTQTFTQIVNDLDTCIKYLPAKWPKQDDYGRITKGAAAAMLGRVLVTWASPQWNPNNDRTRWQAAYDANTAAVSILTANGYGLYPKIDVTMWTLEGSSAGAPTNPEAVMVTEYNNVTNANSDGMNNTSYTSQAIPKYLGAAGGGPQPTWNFVQSFPMADGKDTLTSKYKSGYSNNTFYQNRDPRFYQTIAYNGCNWPVLGNSAYRLWTYYYYTDKNGKATKSTEPTVGTTGFYCRKAVDPSIGVANILYSGTDWMEIRYAEVVLNLAESAAELDRLATGQEAYAGLIAIRKRAGIEPGTDGMYGLKTGMSHADLVNAVMFERKIEFAYEGKRYWDLRRRKLLESTLNGPGKRRTALNIFLVQTGNPSAGTGSTSDYIASTHDASANNSLDALYSTSFKAVPKTLDTYDLNVQAAYYYFGIPTASLNNNVNLQQNNTWGGPFNPLQ